MLFTQIYRKCKKCQKDEWHQVENRGVDSKREGVEKGTGNHI